MALDRASTTVLTSSNPDRDEYRNGDEESIIGGVTETEAGIGPPRGGDVDHRLVEVDASRSGRQWGKP